MKVVIIGGGISGLATAYFLSQHGLRPTLIEKSPRLGGLIQTNSEMGCLLEAGADSYLAAKPAVTELAGNLGHLGSEIIGSNDARRRIFVVRHGKLVPFPQGMVMIAPSEWQPALRSPLFSPATKLRFLAETLSSPRTRSADISIAEFVQDHFGKEVLDYVAEPLLAGVYGGDSSALSVNSALPRFLNYERTYGSLIKGVRQERASNPSGGSLFLSFQNGMQSLTDALSEAIRVSTDIVHAEVRSISHQGNRWKIILADGSSADADHVVLACPTYAAATLIEYSAPALAAELAPITYSSAILATFVYARSDLDSLDGFGFLVPRPERHTIAAATFIANKFPSRIAPHLAAIRAFLVGTQATELLDADPRTITELVRQDLHRLLGISSSPLFTSVKFWPRSMPQYLVGHEQRINRIFTALAQSSGLHLAGNAYDGVGIPDCVRRAKETAKHIYTSAAAL